MYRIAYFIPIWLIYLALTANLQPSNLVIGAFISLGIVAFLRPAKTNIEWKRVPSQLWALMRYILVLAVDIILSGVAVARIVLDPALPLHPGIIAVPSKCESDLALSINAHATSITPGELVVEIGSDGTLYTHCLDASKGPEYIVESQKLRRDLLQKIVT